MCAHTPVAVKRVESFGDFDIVWTAAVAADALECRSGVGVGCEDAVKTCGAGGGMIRRFPKVEMD